MTTDRRGASVGGCEPAAGSHRAWQRAQGALPASRTELHLASSCMGPSRPRLFTWTHGKTVQNSDRVFHHEPVVALNPGALLSLSFLYAERSGQRERLRSCCGRTGARLIFASRPSFLRFVFFYEMCSEGAFSNAQCKSVISEKALPHIEHAKSNRDQTRLQKRKRLRSEY